ncbi:MAG: NADH-quinone oxidoreductase subunit H [Candidatus Omnitrophica bacterium CG11_big_fil_rev_8_21_14_0_20_63_9]|nr:MAG: NADH-quinone oxidoreductase subunit H [Candidatus Omnitrophica bacterium CG11_big_fil_rev_8_21_14_0_20_63_9]
MWEELLIKLAVSGAVLGGVLNLAGMQTWLERKQSALMQDRIGANRAYFTVPWWLGGGPVNWVLRKLGGLGILNALADVIKLLTKEDIIPAKGNRFLHTLAPFLSVFFALLAFAAIPIGPPLILGGRQIPLQVADINAGLLFILALASIGVYGVILAGLTSGNNLSTLGGLRAASQMLAYEIALGVSLIGLVVCYGTLDMGLLVERQGELLWGWLPRWGVLLQPVGCIVFMTAALAETKRVPFDLPEGEPEIIGYFTEYSGMKFGLFFLTDFVEVVLVAALTTALFFGGWQVPYLQPGGFVFPWGAVVPVPHLAYVGLGLLSFTVKVVAFIWFFMLIRWTLPRFRYDQLMHLGWKILFPLSLLNIAVTSVVIVVGSAHP